MNNYICTNRTPDYKDRIEKIIKTRKKEILDFFEVEDDKKYSFNIYIYDTQEELVNGMKERGFETMPDHMCACQKDEDNSLNFFEPLTESTPNKWDKDLYDNCIFHELIHGIHHQIYGKQPEWLTEGVAKYLDGTYSKGKKALLENYINKNRIPPMRELEKEFGWHEYDSYDYAYLMVSYLIETIGKKNFLEVIKDPNNISQISENLPEKSIKFYNEKYFSYNYLSNNTK